MTGITLASPVSRGSDRSVDVLFVGINYDQTKVIVRVSYQPSGTTRDFTFEGQALLALKNNVASFSGLRVALLAYLQALSADLAGDVS